MRPSCKRWARARWGDCLEGQVAICVGLPQGASSHKSHKTTVVMGNVKENPSHKRSVPLWLGCYPSTYLSAITSSGASPGPSRLGR